jgi:pilus assembly protein Flp/PilA
VCLAETSSAGRQAVNRLFIMNIEPLLAFAALAFRPFMDFSAGNGAVSMRHVYDFLADESGATAIEYALIAAGIGMAILVAVNSLGTAISSTFDTIRTSLN